MSQDLPTSLEMFLTTAYALQRPLHPSLRRSWRLNLHLLVLTNQICLVLQYDVNTVLCCSEV